MKKQPMLKTNVLPFPPQQLAPIPKEMDTTAFREAWAEWIEYKATTLRQPMPEQAMRMQLRRLSNWGPERAAAAIVYSIGNGSGWQAPYEEESKLHALPGSIQLRSVRDINDVIAAKQDEIASIKKNQSNWRRIVKSVTELLNGEKHVEHENVLHETAVQQIQRLATEIRDLQKRKAGLV